LCAVQGVGLALFALLCWGLQRRGHDIAWIGPCALVVVEAGYPALFPAYAGAAVRPLVAQQVADVGGPWLVSGLLMIVNAGLFAATRAMRAQSVGRVRAALRPCLIAGSILAVSSGYGALRVASVDATARRAPKLTVGVVQAEMPPLMRVDDRREIRRAYVEQSKQLDRRVDLLVWPETTLHYALAPETKSVRQVLGPIAMPVLFGGLTQRAEDELYNSAYLADASGRVLGRVDKQKLIPFSEYVPLRRLLPALDRVLPYTGQFVAGTEFRGLTLGQHRIAALLCYEDLLPRFARTMVDRTAAHLIVSLSNDVWFGRSTATHIHEALARLRAIEQRRYLVRANNSGVSAVMDATGRTVARSEPFSRHTLIAEVAMLQGDSGYARSGDLCAWLAVTVLVIAFALGARPTRSR
jgi:apolipoprotein N-acyltransferase